jgi:hypothetical protein
MLFGKEAEILQLNSKTWEIGPRRMKVISFLVKKYGINIIADLNKVITNPFFSLQAAATKHHVSRECVRLMIEKVYGLKYTHFSKKLSAMRKENEVYCTRHPAYREDHKRGGKSEAQAFRFLRNMGYDVYPSPTTTYDMVVNGYKVDVKECSKAIKTRKDSLSKYYHFSITDEQTKLCDFFICHALEDDRWFIVPNFRKGTKKPSSIYIRQSEITNQRYINKNSLADPSLHENNWAILKKPTSMEV